MLIEVRPGEGGDDAERFADEVFSSLVSFAAVNGFKIHDIERSQRIRTCRIDGSDTIYTMAGSHRVQRVPKGSAARHTSTATVVVLDDAKVPTS